MATPDPSASAVDWPLTLAPPADDARRRGWWRKVGAPAMSGEPMVTPAGYIVDQPLIDSFNAALTLGQPLLIMGDPGCGKTEAAHHLAWRLGLERQQESQNAGRIEYALRFDTKSTSSARDMFYTYDAIARFYAAQVKDEAGVNVERFITLQAFGRAIVQACDTPEARQLEKDCGLSPSDGKTRAVVLIDEIDKAPRDVPNDLLVEFEKMQFHVVELNRTFRADAAFAPFVVLTSNSEQALPDAFLRRCVFHHMPFPGKTRLDRILVSRVRALKEDEPFRAWLIGFFLRIREEGFERSPGVAELLGLAEALTRLGVSDLNAVHSSEAKWYGAARSVLFKKSEDRERADDDTLKALAKGA